MAIAYDNVTNGGAVSFVKTLTYSHTCSGDNRILIVYVASHVNTITGVTYNGTSLTLIGDSIFCASNRYVTMWYLIAPSTGANNVVVTSTDDALIDSFACSYTGTKQSGQPDGYTNGGNDTLTTSYSISHTTIADNCWTIMGGWNGFNGSTHASVGADTTLRAEKSPTGAGGWLVDSNGAKTPAGAVTLTMTTSVNNNFRGKSFSIAPYVVTQNTTNFFFD